jgi:lipopolysaccharide export system permease protein
MRVLNRYLLVDYLVMFSMTLLVLTFVMCVGAVMQAIDLISRGVSPWIILRAFSYNIPYILTFSIPMSALTTVLLLFGRLSLDGEITAMRASGLSMWQIVAPVIFSSIVLSIICVYLNINAAPNAHWARRQALVDVGIEDPISLLEEGRFIRDFPGLIVFVDRKDRNEVFDIIVHELDGNRIVRSVRARRGTLSMPERHVMLVELFDVRVDHSEYVEGQEEPNRTIAYAAHYPVPLDFSRLMRRGTISKTRSSMTLNELTHAIRNVREVYPELDGLELRRARMRYLVEANERLALSLSCFAFTLLGIPLGMKSRRRESSIGILISLGVVFVFYFFIIMADALVKHPHLHPDMIVWIPVLGGELLGFWLIRRHD